MKKVILVFVSLVMVVATCACSSNLSKSVVATTNFPIVTNAPKASEEEDKTDIPNEIETTVFSEAEYEKMISFPTELDTYDYYSYGYHYSTTTLKSYTYEVSEQSSDSIRIDFKFTYTLDYAGEHAAGSSANFFVVVYSIDNKVVKGAQVNFEGNVGDTATGSYTLLIDKSDILDGIRIAFEGKK